MIDQKELEKIIIDDDLGRFKEIKKKQKIDFFSDRYKVYDYTGMHLLHFSLWQKAINIAKYIIPYYKDNKAINLQIFDKGFQSASVLHLGISTGNLDIVSLLIESGVDVNSLGAFQEPALITAIKGQHIDIAKRLIQNPRINVFLSKIIGGKITSPSALWWACYKGYDSLVALLLEKGMDVFYLTTESMINGFELYDKKYLRLNPFHVAAMEGHANVIKCFAKAKAINKATLNKLVNCCNEQGHTPLQDAGNLTVIKLLIEQCGIDIQHENFTASIFSLLKRKDKAISNYIATVLLEHPEAQQNNEGFFQSFKLLRFNLNDFDDAIKIKISRLIAEEAKTLATINKNDHQCLWINSTTPLVYSSHHSNALIRTKKTVALPVEKIQGHLKYLHDKFYPQLSQKVQTQTNFILAALTFITSSKPHEATGSHHRESHTFLISGEKNAYFCQVNEPIFLQRLINRCYSSGAEDTTMTLITQLGTTPLPQQFMHSEQSFMDFMSTTETIKQIVTALKQERIREKFKIYGVAIHLHSTYAVSETMCKETIVGFQNSKKDRAGFLNLLTRELLTQGYKLPIRKNQLPIFTSFSFSQNQQNSNDFIPIEIETAIEINQDKPNSLLVHYTDRLAKNENFTCRSISSRPFSFFVSGNEVITDNIQTSNTSLRSENTGESSLKKQRT